MILLLFPGNVHFHPINHHDSPIVSRKCPFPSNKSSWFSYCFQEMSQQRRCLPELIFWGVFHSENQRTMAGEWSNEPCLIVGRCMYNIYIYIYILRICIYCIHVYIYMITEHTQSYTYIIIWYTCMISWLIFRRIWVILEHYLKYSELGKKTRKVNTSPKEQTTIVTLYG